MGWVRDGGIPLILLDIDVSVLVDRHSQMSASVVERSSHSAQEAMVQKRISPSNSPAVLVILTLLFVCVGAEVSDVFCGDDARREEV